MNKIKMIAAMFIAGILLTFVSCGDNGKSKKKRKNASYVMLTFKRLSLKK